MSGEFHAWGSRLATLVASRRWTIVDRAVVIERCASTQDEAERLAAGRPGLLVVALCQTHGRGRLGRPWRQDGMGVAATFTLEASRFDPGVLSLAAGVAAAEAVGQALASVRGRVGLKWPNDVVAWVGEHRPDRPPKIAGCLVEVKGGVALAGIGINVRQQAEDFPPEWTDRCTSLAMLGSTEDSIDVIERLVPSLDAALTLPRDVLAEAWRRRDVLVGTVRTVEYDGVRHRGLVESIDPFACLRLATPTGPIDLPARGASVVWE